jgi:hypothetical protein
MVRYVLTFRGLDSLPIRSAINGSRNLYNDFATVEPKTARFPKAGTLVCEKRVMWARGALAQEDDPAARSREPSRAYARPPDLVEIP